jgi:hypothetical protein
MDLLLHNKSLQYQTTQHWSNPTIDKYWISTLLPVYFPPEYQRDLTKFLPNFRRFHFKELSHAVYRIFHLWGHPIFVLTKVRCPQGSWLLLLEFQLQVTFCHAYDKPSMLAHCAAPPSMILLTSPYFLVLRISGQHLLLFSPSIWYW